MSNKSKEGFQNILVVIILYTIYCWAVPIMDKKQETLVEAFENYFEKDSRIPKYIWFDKESGIKSKFFKRFCDENNIILYHTENEEKL